MMKPDRRLTVNPDGFMEGIFIGVLNDCLTQKFIDSRYQLADQKVDRGASGRETAVKNAISGTIDAFASDGILLVGEAFRQGLKENQYALKQNRPLICIYDDMILPTNDSEWQKTVNEYNEYVVTKRQINTITDILTRLAGGTSPFIGVTISAQDKCRGL